MFTGHFEDDAIIAYLFTTGEVAQVLIIHILHITQFITITSLYTYIHIYIYIYIYIYYFEYTQYVCMYVCIYVYTHIMMCT